MSDIAPEIAYIRNATRNYAAYYAWVPTTLGDTLARSAFMASLRRDWETIGAIYRIRARQAFWKNWKIKS